jgi:hypothetical protein
MRSLVSVLVLVLATVVSAISSAGDRLLAIVDDVADKAKYSTFLGDLESAFVLLDRVAWRCTVARADDGLS